MCVALGHAVMVSARIRLGCMKGTAVSFWDFFWLMVWGFFFVLYLMVLFRVVVDIFRDQSSNGWVKGGWLVALCVAPPLTGIIYLIARGDDMAKRQAADQAASQAALGNYIRSVAQPTSPAQQIATAKELLDTGAINADEFERLKAMALA